MCTAGRRGDQLVRSSAAGGRSQNGLDGTAGRSLWVGDRCDQLVGPHRPVDLAKFRHPSRDEQPVGPVGQRCLARSAVQIEGPVGPRQRELQGRWLPRDSDQLASGWRPEDVVGLTRGEVAGGRRPVGHREDGRTAGRPGAGLGRDRTGGTVFRTGRPADGEERPVGRRASGRRTWR